MPFSWLYAFAVGIALFGAMAWGGNPVTHPKLPSCRENKPRVESARKDALPPLLIRPAGLFIAIGI